MTAPAPADHFTVNLSGEPHNITMSFGLLNELVRTVGDLEAVGEIAIDNELRNAVLNELFAERDELGKIKAPVNLFLLAISPDEAVAVLEWVGSHVTDFLLKQLTNTKGIMEARKDQVAALMPTSTGSPT